MTQAQLAAKIGLSIATYQRLEEDRMDNPPLRYLVNAAIALKVALEEVCEPDWLQWSELRSNRHPRERQSQSPIVIVPSGAGSRLLMWYPHLGQGPLTCRNRGP
jgi:transcriptional regulator with XRE-family HTH domain